MSFDLCVSIKIIILGNDNDLAGQLENFKLAYHTANIEYAINSKTQRVLLTVNGAERRSRTEI